MDYLRATEFIVILASCWMAFRGGPATWAAVTAIWFELIRHN